MKDFWNITVFNNLVKMPEKGTTIVQVVATKCVNFVIISVKLMLYKNQYTL